MTQLEKAMAYLDQYQGEMMTLWENLVRLESPSSDPSAVDKLASHLDTYCRALGMETEKFRPEGAGTCLAAQTAPGDLSPVLLLGHIDTVHPIGSFPGGPWTIGEDGFVHGPGAHDCKGGLVIALYVIRALQHAGFDRRQLKLAVVSDEETGHALSQMQSVDFLRRHAEGCGAAFPFESGLMNGDIVTRRKGAVVFKLIVDGIASHCGTAPEKGANAIREAAKKIIAIEDLTDMEHIICNCGKISGGTTVNTIPAKCVVDVTFRFQNNHDRDIATEKVQAICAKVETPKTHCSLTPFTGFPAMEEIDGTAELVKVYQDASEALGLPRPGTVSTAGCSDSAYTTALGIPTLCAVGVRGEGQHSPLERADPASLVTQAKRLAISILTLPETF